MIFLRKSLKIFHLLLQFFNKSRVNSSVKSKKSEKIAVAINTHSAYIGGDAPG